MHIRNGVLVASGVNAGQVVFIGVFALHPVATVTAGGLQLRPPQNLTGAQLRASIQRRTSAAYKYVPGLTDIPVITDGVGRYQVSWTLGAHLAPSADFRALICRTVDRDSVRDNLRHQQRVRAVERARKRQRAHLSRLRKAQSAKRPLTLATIFPQLPLTGLGEDRKSPVKF